MGQRGKSSKDLTHHKRKVVGFPPPDLASASFVGKDHTRMENLFWPTDDTMYETFVIFYEERSRYISRYRDCYFAEIDNGGKATYVRESLLITPQYCRAIIVPGNTSPFSITAHDDTWRVHHSTYRYEKEGGRPRNGLR